MPMPSLASESNAQMTYDTLFSRDVDGNTISLEPLPGKRVPEPFRSLLVHVNNMTPTLERHHDCKIHIRVLRCSLDETCNVYTRQVVLELNGSNMPVEYGIIRIFLDAYPEEGRRLILEGKVPLGTILARCGIQNTSKPSGFYSLRPSVTIRKLLSWSRRLSDNVSKDNSNAEPAAVNVTCDGEKHDAKENGRSNCGCDFWGDLKQKIDTNGRRSSKDESYDEANVDALPEGRWYYARRNVLKDARHEQTLAEVLEILPHCDEDWHL
eukprot:TRINITY_DN8889_c0_g1_i1.p1 TRINITY_DN8889_c0_g1~~TRINITY_DN8889_c0_g1_i1.p1  ORF type:complete len:267 (-),score=22.57 TRINITY_DN8889_c0_g1_i1:44-844(-)